VGFGFNSTCQQPHQEIASSSQPMINTASATHPSGIPSPMQQPQVLLTTTPCPAETQHNPCRHSTIATLSTHKKAPAPAPSHNQQPTGAPADGSSDTLCPAESPTLMRSPIDTLRVRPLGALMDCPSSSYSKPASISGLAVSGRPVGCSARGVSCRAQKHRARPAVSWRLQGGHARLMRS
jgi:hypothetical protein